MAEDTPNLDPDDVSRIIMLVYGFLDTGGPFWAYVAVKPSMYEIFQSQQRQGVLDLYNFAPFGEIVVSGTGEVPPDEVTMKVAEIYNTDASKFFTTADPQKEVGDKMEALRQSLSKSEH